MLLNKQPKLAALNDYFAKSGASGMLTEMVETLMLARPANPAAFFSDYCSRTDPSRFLTSAPDSSGFETSLAFGGSTSKVTKEQLLQQLQDGLLLTEQEKALWVELNETPRDRHDKLLAQMAEGHLLTDEDKAELRTLRMTVLKEKMEEGHLLTGAEMAELGALVKRQGAIKAKVVDGHLLTDEEKAELQSMMGKGGKPAAAASPCRTRGGYETDEEIAAKLGQFMVDNGYVLNDLNRGMHHLTHAR